ERIARNFQLGVRTESGSDRVDHASENGNGAHEFSDERREELARVVEECTTSITREVAGLKALVDEFARFARMPPPRLEAGDLNDVIQQTAALYEERLNGVELQLRIDPQMPSALLDVEQMKRVFVNLIDNAVEAMTDIDGERRLVITTRHDATRDLVLATVDDTGEGIVAGDFKRLFQPYFST